MWEDPIVQEVRKAGDELAKKYDYDVHLYFEGLRKNEKSRKLLKESKKKIKILK
jgi:hypothetical protein